MTTDGTGTDPRTRTGAGLSGAATQAVLATSGGLVAAFVTSALAPQLRGDLGLTAARLGVVVAVFFATSSLTAPLSGRLVDRMGSVRVMRAALLLAAACLSWIGFAVHDWGGLATVLACAGVANGAIQPAANRYIGRLIPPHHQGTAFGIKQSAIPAAMLIGGLAVPVAAYVADWRTVYVATAAAVGITAAAVRRPPPAQRAATISAPPPPSRKSAGSSAALIVLAIGWGLASAGSNALGSFFVLTAVQAGYSAATAGILAMAGALCSITARVVAGILADRQSGSGLSIVAAMSAAGAVGIALLATNQLWAYVAAILLGYGLGSGWGGLFSYAIVTSYPKRPGHATGITQAGASAGSCLGPLGFGLVAATGGYPAAWLATGGTLLAAVAMVLVGRRMLRSAEAPLRC
ncbi:MFS transporter [Haloactinomyces albus]|uniref:MFS family permease n=1 Tax=Haloactinomyces albus TaxID=1352928 RepID=A0AAE3ZHD9_9ACTN|nr:MFS transporter [Haloactinomyces albus]MDR7303710.1 MFS family permease [Haloactinomyces albus]